MASYPGVLGLDATFELDHFQRPRLRDESELVKDVLMRILLMRPGQIPSLPNLGMDIRQRLYEFYDTLNVDELQQELIDSCRALQKFFDVGSIVIRKERYRNRPALSIYVETSPSDSVAESYANTQRRANNRAYYIGLSYDDLKNFIMAIKSQPI